MTEQFEEAFVAMEMRISYAHDGNAMDIDDRAIA